MPKTHLKCHGVADEWIRVEDGDEQHFVSTIKIAGTDLSIPYSGTVELACDDYTIEGEYAPSLLIESASWYTPPEDRPDARDELADDSYTVDVSDIEELEFHVDDDIRVIDYGLQDGAELVDDRSKGVAVTRDAD